MRRYGICNNNNEMTFTFFAYLSFQEQAAMGCIAGSQFQKLLNKSTTAIIHLEDFAYSTPSHFCTDIDTLSSHSALSEFVPLWDDMEENPFINYRLLLSIACSKAKAERQDQQIHHRQIVSPQRVSATITMTNTLFNYSVIIYFFQFFSHQISLKSNYNFLHILIIFL